MIVGISGKQQSGKDYTGALIQRLQPEKNWKIVKYADKLKDIICLMIGCTREQLEDDEFKNQELGKEWSYYITPGFNKIITTDEYDKLSENQKEYCKLIVLTPRKLLQLVGTEAGRNIVHPNIWINATFSTYEESDNWIITDVRFPNEALHIKKKGGIVIRLDRPLGERYPELMSKFMQDRDTGQDFKEWLMQNDNKMYSAMYHESETSLDDYDFDYIVENVFDDKLQQQIETILNE